LHGNAGNISHRLDSIALFRGLGLEALNLNYRGYGQSTGTPSEAGLHRDAEAAWPCLTRTRGRTPGEIVVFGRSLGDAVAAWLAERTQPGALIIESTFTSLPDLAAQLYPWLPARALARMRFDTRDALTRMSSPVLVIHSRDDEIVPYAQARSNLEAIPSPKPFLQLQGVHKSMATLLSETNTQPATEYQSLPTQFSNISPLMRSNSRGLLVTRVCPRRNACAAIWRS
jgi:hypothetical protein